MSASVAPLYAEVIVPLPLYSAFTYLVPPAEAAKVKVGSRVIVPFGPKKFYTGVVTLLTPRSPGDYAVKEIHLVLDDGEPVVRHPQLKFWDWIAEYYLCAPGDVMKAALPAGLKVESETFVELNTDRDTSLPAADERRALVIQALDHEGHIPVGELERVTGLHGIESLVSKMLEEGTVIVHEKLVERYRVKKEQRVRLTFSRDDMEEMRKAFLTVRTSKKQEHLLVTLVNMLNKQRATDDSGEVPRAALLEAAGVTPAILSALAGKGVVEIVSREVSRFSCPQGETAPLPVLSPAQNAALAAIDSGFTSTATMLLHGVTSSGKTEIYIHLIDRVLREGNQALFLVPEIALTTQLTRRLQRVFGDKVVIYHSKFSDNERVDIWKRLLHNPEPCVVIGARSSVFLPFGRLGLVIVDEEHEASYKQFDPAPRYNARDCAIVLASMHGARTLLGSATPSVETYYKASTGRYGLVSLTERFEGVELPAIEIVDMTDERRRGRLKGPLSLPVSQVVRDALGRGEQVILFHNRRGFAPVVTCRQCGYVPKCQHCDVSLTYHRRAGEMVCHYCGATYRLPTVCPACKEPAIEVYGYGTERLEDIADAAFGNAKVLRMDLDTTRNKDAYENIITDFSRGKAQILVGTQMVTKGLDFDRVSAVGVLNADTLINIPDFRSAERAFNMLEQVAGRAGRRSTRGLVMVQTTQPSHPVINFLRTHDYLGFYNHELEERRRFNYPPFTRIINIYLKHRDEEPLIRASAIYADRLRSLLGNRVFGPDEPHVARIQNLYIRKVMLKVEITASMRKVKELLRGVYNDMLADKTFRGLTLYYDVDPN